jgi:hypothetical protein
VQPLSTEFSQLSPHMRRRSRSVASAPPLPEDLSPSAGAVIPAASAVPVAAPGPASGEPASDAALVSVATSGLASAASGQFSLSLAPASASLPSLGPSGAFPGPFLPVVQPPGPPGVHSAYLDDGSVTINFSWVRQHHPLVVDVLASHDCLSLWPDICAELSAKYAPALEAGRFPERWLLSPAGRTAIFLVVEELVQAYKASELCAVTSRLRAMVQVSAPPAVSVPVGHPGSHQAVSQGADSPGVAVPVLPLPPILFCSPARTCLVRHRNGG